MTPSEIQWIEASCKAASRLKWKLQLAPIVSIWLSPTGEQHIFPVSADTPQGALYQACVQLENITS